MIQGREEIHNPVLRQVLERVQALAPPSYEEISETRCPLTGTSFSNLPIQDKEPSETDDLINKTSF